MYDDINAFISCLVTDIQICCEIPPDLMLASLSMFKFYIYNAVVVFVRITCVFSSLMISFGTFSLTCNLCSSSTQTEDFLYASTVIFVDSFWQESSFLPWWPDRTK